MNKVIEVPLTGGLIGLFVASPHRALHNAVARENAEGWRVVQVIPAASGSIFYFLLRNLLLLVTLFLYTFDPGFYIFLERNDHPPAGSRPLAEVAKLAARLCLRCGHEYKVADAFCERCGNKLT